MAGITSAMRLWTAYLFCIGTLLVTMTAGGHCPAGRPIKYVDIMKGRYVAGRTGNASIFDELTQKEIYDVLKFMFKQTSMKLQPAEKARVDQSYIAQMEVLPPKKADALRYLDRRAQKPWRAAKVVVYRGDLSRPIIEEYKVGPLPYPTSITLIRKPKLKHPIPFHVRSALLSPERREMDKFMRRQLGSIETVLSQITHGFTYRMNCTFKCLEWGSSWPGEFREGARKTWIFLRRRTEDSYLQPIGLQFRINHRTLFSQDWEIDRVWFRGEFYRDLEVFRLQVHHHPHYRYGGLGSTRGFGRDDGPTPTPNYRDRGRHDGPDGSRRPYPTPMFDDRFSTPLYPRRGDYPTRSPNFQTPPSPIPGVRRGQFPPTRSPSGRGKDRFRSVTPIPGRRNQDRFTESSRRPDSRGRDDRYRSDTYSGTRHSGGSRMGVDRYGPGMRDDLYRDQGRYGGGQYGGRHDDIYVGRDGRYPSYGMDGMGMGGMGGMGRDQYGRDGMRGRMDDRYRYMGRNNMGMGGGMGRYPPGSRRYDQYGYDRSIDSRYRNRYYGRYGGRFDRRYGTYSHHYGWRDQFGKLHRDRYDEPSYLTYWGQPEPRVPQRGPRGFYPDGRRYEVNGHHVYWQGWGFEFNMRTTMGLQVHNIRFLRERIIYELSLQEISVRYTGHSPGHVHASYHHSSFQLGVSSYELVKGLDCPYQSESFDFVHYVNGRPKLYKNSACLFEWNQGLPLNRHRRANLTNEHGYDSIQGMTDSVLILRAMITVDNFDYMLDYIFHQNGAIEVKTAMTGFLQAAYYTGRRDYGFGYQVGPDLMGDMSHHAFNFKVDLDILGQSNRFENLDISVQPVAGPTFPGETLSLHQVARNLKRTEKQAAYKFHFDTPKYLMFHNWNYTNRYYNPRAYRIVPQTVTKWMVPLEWGPENAFSWARYQMAVTKHKDDEDASSSIYATMEQVEPVMTFQSYIEDNDYIVDEDLVAWVTLGNIHIPTTEDIPMVDTTGNENKFYILPFNYFFEDPSKASRDNLRVTPKWNGEKYYEYAYGMEGTVRCMPMSSGANAQHTFFSFLLLGVSLLLCLGV